MTKRLLTLLAVSLASMSIYGQTNDNPTVTEKPSVSSTVNVDVFEDGEYTFKPEDFKFQHASLEFESVAIVVPPDNGYFFYNGTIFNNEKVITVADITAGKLTYKPFANQFGEKYTTFKYRVIGSYNIYSDIYAGNINVIPVNDKPTVDDIQFFFTVDELSHKVSGDPIVVKDAKNEMDVDTYTFNLVKGNPDNTAFRNVFEIKKISNNKATITVKPDAVLNYDKKNQYTVKVTVADDAATETQTVNGPQTSDDFDITINIKTEKPSVSSTVNVDVFEDGEYTFKPEDFKFQHASLEFESVAIVVPPDNGYFFYNGTIFNNEKVITVADITAGKLTYKPFANQFGEKYTTFKYRVIGSYNIYSDIYAGNINVIPVNDKPTVANVVFAVNELDHAISGGPIVVSDAPNERDADTYSYELVNVAGSDYAAFNNIFEISKLSNQNATINVKSGAVIDYKQKSNYVVYATVTDDAATETQAVNGPQTSERFKITINIKNQNDAPTFENQTFTKPEKQSNGKNWQAGASVGKVTTASDPDDDQLTYNVLTTGVPFKFNNGSNELVITDGSVLDYETKPKWELKVQVSDGELTATATVTVNITNVNEGPENLVLKNEYSVDENTSTGESFGTFEFFDPDAGDKLTYSITGALTGAVDAATAKKNLSDIFELTESKNNNGTRTVSINVKNASMLDYEKLFIKNKGNATYQASVTVKDSEGLSVTKTTNIAIKDVNEKVSAKGGTFYLNEHSPIGSPVCAVQYKDDENNPLDCSKVARVEGSDLDIYADDDVYSDNDAFNNLTYQIIPNKQNGTDYKKFSIDPHTGILYSNDEFDYESGSHKFTFIVTVSDGTYTSDASVTVNIEDITEPTNNTFADINQQPTITNTTPLSVSESYTSANGVFGKVTATDPDNAYGTSHPYGFNKLTYKVEEVIAVDGSTDFPFELNPNTGEFTVAKGQKLDYTKQHQYKCIVKVTDNPRLFDDAGQLIYPPLSTTATITINVIDENRPSEFRVLDTSYEEEENMNVNTVLEGKQIVVYDEDDADLDKLKITITDKNPTLLLDAAKLFDVVQIGKTDKTTHLSKFVIITKAEKNYEDFKSISKATFDIILTIKDTKNRSKYPQQDTRIQIIDVNEEPAFTNTSYPFTIKENTVNATTLGMVSATDPDIYNDRFGTLYFSLEGDDAAQFDINNGTGEIFTKNNAKFDYETKKSYSFNVIVTDKKFTKEANVTVNVMNVNETPVFHDVPDLAVDENSEKGTKVGVVTADDDDCKNNNTSKKPTYTLAATDVAADDYKSFNIDKTTGTIKVNGALNFEKKDEYSVRVVATDGDDPALTDYVDVTIKINDVNDKPYYAENEYVFEVHENAPIGEFVGRAIVDDEDEWSKLTYTLSDYESGSMDSEAFKIVDGKIYTNTNSLNYETNKQYQVVAKATDNGKAYGESIGRTDFRNYTATTLVTINLIDDPDAPEIIDDGNDSYDIYENTVEQNTPNGFEIACYEVKDEDKGHIATLMPFLTDAGNTDAENLFDAKIKKTSTRTYMLCLIVKDGSLLDYETGPRTHTVNIGVEDADELTTQITKTINITDVNEMPIINGNTELSFYEGHGAGYVVGQINNDDTDISDENRQNVFSAIGGDTDLFTITESGTIKALRNFDFETEARRTFELKIALSDNDADNYPTLTTQATITINLLDGNELTELGEDAITIRNCTYTGEPQKPVIIVKDGETTLTEGTDYDIVLPADHTNAGTHTVSIVGKNNYCSSIEKNFNIYRKNLTISAAQATKEYGAQEPALTYTTEGLAGTDAVSGSLSREAGENIGSYSINIGTLDAGQNYDVTFNESVFTIYPKEITIDWGNTEIEYTGNEFAPQVTIKGLVGDDVCDITITGSRTDVGTFTATATALSNANYKLPEDVTKVFTINKKEIVSSDSKLIIELSDDNYYFDGDEKRPTVTIKYNGIEIPTDKYTVTYEDNVEAGTTKVIVRSANDSNYVFEITKTFTIEKLNAVKSTDSDATEVGLISNTIYIKNAPYGAKYSVTYISGRCIISGTIRNEREEITLYDRGVYIVSINNRSFKIRY